MQMQRIHWLAGAVRKIAALLALAVLVFAKQAWPAEFIVTNDSPNGTGSFLEAVQIAGATQGPDTIRFDPGFFSTPRTITMDRLLALSEALTVEGPGRDLLTIVPASVQLLTYAGIDVFRVPGTDVQDFVWSGLTLEQSRSAQLSGVVRSSGHSLEFREARLLGSGQFNSTPGPAIAVYDAELTLRDTVVENFVSAPGAGAVFIDVRSPTNTSRTPATIERSTFRGNRTVGSGGAVAIFVRAGVAASKAVVIRDSEFSRNEATRGGAIYGQGAIEFSISNSTFSGNSTTQDAGGAIFIENDSNYSASLALGTTTITDNVAASFAGGIVATGTLAPSLRVANSVIAANRAGASAAQDMSVADVVTSYSLIGAKSGANPGLAIVEHQAAIGTTLIDTNPMLGSLSDNGGATRTHAVQAGSPLLDAGNVNAPTRDVSQANPATDQRGAGFPRISNAAMDIGAFELQVSGGGNGAAGGGGSAGPWLLGWLLALAGLLALRCAIESR